MLDSVQRLEECEADFTAIEQHLDDLKAQIGSSMDASLVSECSNAIIHHERNINRQIVHFDHALSQHKSSIVLDKEFPGQRVLESIDELVRLHLQDSGYASVAELMQKENPEALGLDFTIKSGLLERAVESSLFALTDGDLGRLVEVEKPPRSFSLEHDEALLLDFFNSREKEGSNSKIEGTVQKLKRYLRSTSLPSLDPHWAKSRAVEYKFLKCHCEGISAALQFLRTAGSDSDCDTQLISRLAGRLVTSDQEKADSALSDFTIALRAELLTMFHSSESEFSTDLMRMIDISKTALQSNLVALQSVAFVPGGEIPTEIELGKHNWFHPVLVCPVEKEQIPHNQLGVLPCGHILSCKAVDRLSHNGGTVICPCCSERSDIAAIKKCSLFT